MTRFPLELDTTRAENENNTLFNAIKRRYDETTDLRNILAKVFTILITFWLLAVMLLLTGNTATYKLSDSVLITLLTTTTIQILGMMVIILFDLFPGGKKEKSKE
ncbi:hypothetical protein E6C50_01370 [Flavobacterium supellecticarium]|uniref:Uncharacterized protein n=1 Tax=Flavobacterium supellecticarium TaxID=2565924 RepID=A0A4S4A4K8_9FLAO|nr:hypothetical protein [Flavobacterium supellecticarium]THF52885.1 hypothetical protein E6C50_01370 [Flavobacterium supellecticarium]